MKKFLVCFLTIVLLLSLVACGSDDQCTNSNNSTSPSQTEHIHNYTSQVTKEATCTSAGTTTFSCACGDTYTEEIAQTTHNWSDWKRITFAYIDKVGTDERTCSLCDATEVRDRTENAVANSFQDGGLQYVIWSGGVLDAYAMYPYACHEFHQYIEKPNVPAADFFALLSQCFNVTEKDIQDIKQTFATMSGSDYGYDPTTDTFFLPYHAETGNFLFLGYKHNGGNRYTTYYSYSEFSFEESEEFYWSFEVEYNRSNGAPNKYLSAAKVDSVPDDLIQTDGWAEFEGTTAN